jgi:hypothetical protein
MKRLNADFRLHLPIDTNITTEENEELQKRREAVRKRQEEETAWLSGLDALWDEWCRLDRQRMFCRVGSPAWVEAVKNIDRVADEIDCYPEKPR